MKLWTRRTALLIASAALLGLGGWFGALGAIVSLLVCLALFVVVLVWWLALRPSNERDWSPEYVESPWAEIDGDETTIHNFRHCDYRTATDCTARWETRTFHLSKLCGVDFIMNFWGSPHFAHTFVSFDFGDEGHVCTSIEARRERCEPYSPIRGLFRQYELYYAIGDERDLIALRTNYRHQAVHVYRLAEAAPEKYRALFLSYLRAANELRARPRWYLSALDNCTTNIRVNARLSGFASAWDWRLLANGHIDELLYERGLIPASLPFPETKVRAWINERAKAAAGAPDFSERIRVVAATLPRSGIANTLYMSCAIE